MNMDILEEVVDKLVPFLPADWERMCFFVGINDYSQSVNLYFDIGEGYVSYLDKFKYTHQFGVASGAAISLICNERNKLSEKDKWYCLVLLLDNQGNFKTHFEYDPVEEIDLYGELVEKKYLNM